MKKLSIKLYDKLIIGLLFSAFFMTNCEEPEPVPMYGAVPMYGVPTSTVVAEQAAQPDNTLEK